MSRTHEALLRAEAKHDSIYSKNDDHIDIEQQLLHLKLGREDLENQNLSELTQSLHSINKCLKEPSIALDMDSDDTHLKRKDILPVLLKKKWLVLERIDTIVTEKNILKIRSVLKHIPNSNVQTKIEKHLSFLYRKNEILKKEFRSIAVLDADYPSAIDESQEKSDTTSVSDAEFFDRKKATRSASKWSSGPGTLSIIVIAGLLAFWGAAIAVTHFFNFTVPVAQEYAFLVTLGFLLGILLRTSQKSAAKKKE